MSVWFRSQAIAVPVAGELLPEAAHRLTGGRAVFHGRTPARVLAGADPRTFAFLHAGMLWICGGSVFRQAVEDWPEGAPSGVAFEVAEVSRLYGFVVWRDGRRVRLRTGSVPSAPGSTGLLADEGDPLPAEADGVAHHVAEFPDEADGARAMAEWLKPDRPTSDADLWDPLKAPRHFDLGTAVVFAVVAAETGFAPPAWDGPGVEADVYRLVGARWPG